MALDVPDLGDRDYAAFMEAARNRIPVYADAWTDHNAHDPGITILETLAWLADTYVYQLDRQTDRHVRKYLQLVGRPPRGPIPASALVRTTLPPDRDPVELAAGTTLSTNDAEAGSLLFEMALPEGVDAITLAPARLARVVSDLPDGRVDHTVAADTDGMQFHPFGPRAAAESALYLGFDGDPFGPAPSPDESPPNLSLGVVVDETGLPAPASHGDETGRFDPSVRVVWEYLPVDDAPDGTRYDHWHDDGRWKSFDVLHDGTNQFYEGGLVVLARPDDWPANPGHILDDEDVRRYWLRAVVRTSGHEVPPRLDAVAVNAVEAAHRSTVPHEVLTPLDGATTTARPNQRFGFARRPVLEATVTVDGDRWDPVADFDAAGPADAVYVLDQAEGVVQFGDDVRGAVPPAGASVEAAYQFGGGAAGNVGAGARWQFSADGFGGVTVDAIVDATGGRNAETVDEALDAARRDLARPYRAVTLADYRQVATSTPGLRFGRARASVEPNPGGFLGENCDRRRVVRTVVLPFSTHDRPTPSPGFLRAVRCHLRRHALLTDEVRVDPPTYVGVGVEVDVRLLPGADAAQRTDAVRRTLDAFLHPLTGYEGDGWPFGRSVYRSEVIATVEGVEGVDCVVDVDLTTDRRSRKTTAGDVRLARAELPYSLSHRVDVRTDRTRCGEGR